MRGRSAEPAATVLLAVLAALVPLAAAPLPPPCPACAAPCPPACAQPPPRCAACLGRGGGGGDAAALWRCVHACVCAPAPRPPPPPPCAPPPPQGPRYSGPHYRTWHGLKYGCGCHPAGAADATCDIVTGQCRCRAGVEGRACDTCSPGHWGLGTLGRCEPCACDSLGAVDATCDPASGQCRCKPGAGGRRCDACLPHHFGFSASGCRPCEPCGGAGRMCDPDTGRCVCPPLTEGATCERCLPGAFGLQPRLGCKPCDCEPAGTTAQRCEPATGRCLCRAGFEGARCERCAPRHHGWPLCRRCSCQTAGTRAHACDAASGLCDCDPDDGSCPCKANVEGARCDRCVEGAFGLTADNPDGCTRCFCFGRSASCTQAGLTWGRVLAAHARTLHAHYGAGSAGSGVRAWAEGPRGERVPLLRGGAPAALNRSAAGGLLEAPDPHAPARPYAPVHVATPRRAWPTPLYWLLPEKFLGDRVLSYGGVLSAWRAWEGGGASGGREFPLVQLYAQGGLVLEHYAPPPPARGPPPAPHPQEPEGLPGLQQGVRFHESLWTVRTADAEGGGVGSGEERRAGRPASREILMVALQNVKKILFQASPYADFKTAVLRDVALETAVAAPGQPPLARGVELCECPPEYNSSSCQDPSVGFYRWYPDDGRQATIVIRLVGEARPCECSGRSRVCDRETGHCLNCSEDTGGPHCERCADAFYGVPGSCRPCPCPGPGRRRNFAAACHQGADGHVHCVCREGYSGARCDRCAYGWFGRPREEGGACQPCLCNPHGSVSDECHEESGQCNCRPGITARDCTFCGPLHVLTSEGCQPCDDSCTGVLLSEVSALSTVATERAKALEVEAGARERPPPWETLDALRRAAAALDTRLREWANAVAAAPHRLPLDAADDLKRRAKLLLNKSKKILKYGEKSSGSSLAVRNEASDLLEEILKLQRETNDIVQGLRMFGVGDGAVNIAEALQEAEYLLDAIRKRDGSIESSKSDAVLVLGKCEGLLDKIRMLLDSVPELGPLRQGLEALTKRLDSLHGSLQNTSAVLAKTRNLSMQNKELLKNTKANVGQLLDFEGEGEVAADEAKELVNSAASFLKNATSNMQRLEENLNAFSNLTRRVMEREGILYRLNPIYEEKYVLKAQEHADLLYRRAQQYRDIFSSTRRDADFALRASKAYQGIVDAINTAHESAINASSAADSAYKTANLGPRGKSPVEQAVKVSQRSEILLKRAEDEYKKAKEVEKEYSNTFTRVNNLKDSLAQGESRTNNIFLELKKLSSSEIHKNAEEAMKRAENAMKMSKESNATATRVRSEVQNKLRPLLATLNRDEFLSEHTEKLIAAQLNIKKIKELLERLKQKTQKERESFSRWNDTIANKLQELKSKITQTRHTAEGIQLSLTSRPGAVEGCIRSYKLNSLTPSTTTSIILNYAIHTDDRDAALFYLANNNHSEFMAVEMVDRHIRFVWNAGGSPGVVVHPKEIEKAVLSEDENWYHIKVERTSNIARLSVRQQITPEGIPGTEAVTNSSEAGFGIVDLRPGDTLWVGGLPPGTSAPQELQASRKGLAGCLHQIQLDGRPLGLWNFATETKDSCAACIAGVEEAKGDSSFKFSGEGYSMHEIGLYDSSDKYQFSVSMKFRTLDENALLFLAVDATRTRFVALYLENGHLVFHIGYGRKIDLQLKTIAKVNIGAWVHCEGVRVFERGLEHALLSMETEKNQRSPAEPPADEDLPVLTEYFLGGIRPGFHLNTSALKLPQAYLGCMSDIQLISGGVNPLTGKFYGVEESCSTTYTVASFQGKGFLHLPSHALKRKKSSFEFVFQSRQPDALLMLTKGLEPKDYFSVALEGGRVIVWVHSDGAKAVLESRIEFNDGQFHSVSVTKQNRKLWLRVDDAEHDNATLGGSEYQVRVDSLKGGLYFGGTPLGVSTYQLAASNVSLIGTIKDAIFNNQLLRFEEHIAFGRANLGRLGPLGYAGEPIASPPAQMLPTECHKVPDYAVEPNAVKFGDLPESFIRVMLGPRSLQKNFAIELSFRTYYPNGRLLIIPGEEKKRRKKQKNYMMIVLRNKQLQVELKGRKKLERIMAVPELNDGLWHNVVLQRQNRTLSILIDQQVAGTRRLPRRLGLSSFMYIGGLPTNGAHIPNIQIENFKGCVRRLAINGIAEHLVGPKALHQNVRQCYPAVERGAYFPGDAYAIYDNEFQIKKLQELELDFRTAEQTGILISVSEPSGYPAVSLELNSGRVVMRYDIGDGKPMQVEQTFPSRFSLCDNAWHSVHANFFEQGLLLKVDNLPSVTGTSQNGVAPMLDTSYPLYIGGIPDNATEGTLLTREFFKGCIRNIVVGRVRKDWSDMAALENVHLNSCPISD